MTTAMLDALRGSAVTYNARGLVGLGARTAEAAFVVFILLFHMGAFAPFLVSDGTQDVDGNTRHQLLFMGTYAGAVVLLVYRRRLGTAALLLLRERWIAALVILALLSLGWSEVPEITLRRLVAMVGTLVVAWYLATRFSIRGLLRYVALASAAAAMLSIAAVILVPDTAIMDGFHEGSWRGVFVHKNTVGRAMALGVVAAVAWFMAARRGRGLAIGIALVCGVVLIMSTSLTALTSTVTVLLGAVLLGILRLRGDRALLVSLALLIATGTLGTIALDNRDALLEAVGRDTTLTGRTGLWSVTLDAVAVRPWLGYGYGGFWTEWSGPSSHVWSRVPWLPPHAHNGWVDVALGLGLAGVVLLVASFGGAIGRSVRLLRRDESWASRWPLVFLGLVLLVNASENTFLVGNNVFWVLQVAIAMQLVTRTGTLRNGA